MYKAVIVDDMRSARNVLSFMLKEYSDIEIVGSFPNAYELFDFLEDNECDLVFLDIEMPGIDGITVAKKFKNPYDKPYIIFATAYMKYTSEAWDTNAIAYVMKPYEKKAIDKAMNKFYTLVNKTRESKKDIFIQCFPNFNVFIKGEVVIFKNAKAKELLAYLVYNRGGFVKTNEICAELLEHLDNQQAQNSMRTYIARLKKTLEENKISELFTQEYGKCKVNTEHFDCDYYDYINGERNLFAGEFLKSYPWAEVALASMEHELQN